MLSASLHPVPRDAPALPHGRPLPRQLDLLQGHTPGRPDPLGPQEGRVPLRRQPGAARAAALLLGPASDAGRPERTLRRAPAAEEHVDRPRLISSPRARALPPPRPPADAPDRP